MERVGVDQELFRSAGLLYYNLKTPSRCLACHLFLYRFNRINSCEHISVSASLT